MTPSRNRTGRVLDVVVVALGVSTVAIVGATGFREYESAHGLALERYRAALSHCDESSGAARLACRSEAGIARRIAAAGTASAEDAAEQSTEVADALSRAQCGVLTGYSTDACGGVPGARVPEARAQRVAGVLAAQAPEQGTNPKPVHRQP